MLSYHVVVVYRATGRTTRETQNIATLKGPKGDAPVIQIRVPDDFNHVCGRLTFTQCWTESRPGTKQ